MNSSGDSLALILDRQKLSNDKRLQGRNSQVGVINDVAAEDETTSSGIDKIHSPSEGYEHSDYSGHNCGQNEQSTSINEDKM